jgi:hypothetical protein
MARLKLKPLPMQEGGGVEDRNRPIIDIIGSQAVAPVLPAGATFVGEGQTAQAEEFQQIPQITDLAPVSTPSITQAPATQITPTTAPTIETAQRAAPAGVMDAATLAAPTQVIDAPQRGVSEQAIPVAAVQDLQEQATVQYQLSELYKTIEEGKPLPPWASPAVRKISSIMQQRGMGSSSMAAAAMTQAIMESGISIAAQDAKAFSQIQLVNLSNRQKVAMQNAVVVSQMDQLNANNRTKGAIANAQAFLTMDLKNLENAQKEAIMNHNADMQALFTDTAAENARQQFNAKNEIQVEEFFAELDSQVQAANANRESAMKQFNASQQNAMQQFSVQTRDARDKFNANMKFAVDQSNAQWRRQLNTTNTAIQNETNRLNAQNAYNASQSALNFLWQKMRDNAQFNFQKGQNALQKNHEVGLLAMEFANTEKLYTQKQKDLVGLKIGEWVANWVVS